MRTKMISIVIPFFNRAPYVIEMIKSIQASTYADWELILVDDGSSDDDFICIEKYVSADSRILLLKRDRVPKGAQTCRNIGFEHVRGEYVCFFDSDDYITPNCLQTRVQHIQNHPDKDFIVFPTGVLKDGKFLRNASSRIFGYPIYKDDLAAFSSRTLPFIVCSNIYRTAAIRSHHLSWDEHLQALQDADFNMQSLVAGLQYDYAPTLPNYFYRVEDASDAITKHIHTFKYFGSHLYALDKSYRIIQQLYGHKYNQSLCRGVLFLFNNIFYNHIDKDKAQQVAHIVTQHDPWRGKCLQTRINILLWLSPIVGAHCARRIVMLDYLVWLMGNSHLRNHKLEQMSLNHISL